MSRSARRSFRLGIALLSGLGYAGCASAASTGTIGNRPTSSDAGSSEAGVGGDNSSTTGTAGKGGMGELTTDPAAGAAGAADDACAADLYKAEQVPLDMYMMLDVSPSMLDTTTAYDALGNPISKWSALKSALESFISDDASSWLGVGVQFFPQVKPDIPSVCAADADCGAAAPCAKSFCATTGDACATQADCPAPATANPCKPLLTCGAFLCDVAGAPCADSGVICGPPATSFCAHAAKCDVETYAEPAVAIAPLPDVGPAIVSAMESQTILAGARVNTPTGPALNGAVEQAASWAAAHPDHRAVVVLVTDGLPSDCTPSSIAGVGKIASDAFAAPTSIRTFAIGVFRPNETIAGKQALDQIALGGGTQHALIIDTSGDVVGLFRAGLETIRNAQLLCELEVPQLSASRNIDYSRVNVNFKTGNKTSTVLYVDGLASCNPLTGGWYYDKDPAKAEPSRIEICPTTCDTFQSTTSGSVQIAVGCQTIVK